MLDQQKRSKRLRSARRTCGCHQYQRLYDEWWGKFNEKTFGYTKKCEPAESIESEGLPPAQFVLLRALTVASNERMLPAASAKPGATLFWRVLRA